MGLLDGLLGDDGLLGGLLGNDGLLGGLLGSDGLLGGLLGDDGLLGGLLGDDALSGVIGTVKSVLGSLDGLVFGDSDADGITDCNDLCANTPSNRQVGSDGCPLPEEQKPYRN